MIDGRRLHLHHGPIDLIIEAFGAATERQAAYNQAVDAFQTVLGDLAIVLPDLQLPVRPGPAPRGDAIADRMVRAVTPHANIFVTPMAAVAGAVADGMLASLIHGRRLERAYVNNGGDIAVFLHAGTTLTAAGGPDLNSRISLSHSAPARGVATSGWRGRSFSLGIADAVTVVARTAAEADVAATLIANAVDLPGHPSIQRVPASEISPDSDLGDRLITSMVGPLTDTERALALAAGMTTADAMLVRDLILGAALWCGNRHAVCGSPQFAREALHA